MVLFLFKINYNVKISKHLDSSIAPFNVLWQQINGLYWFSSMTLHSQYMPHWINYFTLVIRMEWSVCLCSLQWIINAYTVGRGSYLACLGPVRLPGFIPHCHCSAPSVPYAWIIPCLIFSNYSYTERLEDSESEQPFFDEGRIIDSSR